MSKNKSKYRSISVDKLQKIVSQNNTWGKIQKELGYNSFSGKLNLTSSTP